MSTSAKKAGVRGKRYSASEKQDIVAFVEKYNSDNGRGGQSAASKKFGISQLTISSWLKSGSAAPTGKRGKASGKGAGKGSISSKLNKLLSLGTEIEKAEANLASLKAKFAALKASL